MQFIIFKVYMSSVINIIKGTRRRGELYNHDLSLTKYFLTHNADSEFKYLSHLRNQALFKVLKLKTRDNFYNLSPASNNNER